MKIKVKKIHPNAKIPKYEHDGDSGMDLFSTEKILIHSMERVLVPTGLVFEIPKGYEIQVRPKSGLALKSGISMPNTPGTIDSGYRGELKVIVINFSKNNFQINPGDKIAQAVLSKVEFAEIQEVRELNGSSRGAGGF